MHAFPSQTGTGLFLLCIPEYVLLLKIFLWGVSKFPLVHQHSAYIQYRPPKKILLKPLPFSLLPSVKFMMSNLLRLQTIPKPGSVGSLSLNCATITLWTGKLVCIGQIHSGGFSSSEKLLSSSSQTQVPSRSSLRSLADLLHQIVSPLVDKKLVCL